MVGFLRRDIRQITDQERKFVERLVFDQQREAGVASRVTRIVIETDYPDPDRLVYTASCRVYVSGREGHPSEGEVADRGHPD
jgi:hypothetical protein